MAEDAEGAAAAATADFQFGFDFGFKNVEVFVNAPGRNASEFAINKGEVGKNRQAKREYENTGDVTPLQHYAIPSRRRRRISTRFISP